MARTALIALLLAAAVLAGCDRRSRWGATWPSEAERTMRDGRAPTPYTADQIRAGCPSGRRSTFRIDEPGAKPYHHVFAFRDCGEQRCTVAFEALALDGSPIQPARESRPTWEGLQSHASYRRDLTTVERETLHLPAGWFHCMRYTVDTPGEPAGSLTKAWFARELPGPPVRLERYQAGALKLRMTLVRTENVASEGE